jgi:outer membrane protein
MKSLFRIFLAVLFFSANLVTYGQNVWSLQKCIDYALENNIQIKQRQINSTYYENQLNQAKSARLPNLNAQIGNDYNFGRSLTYYNTYENVNSATVSGGLGSDFMLWNGFTLQNEVQRQELDLQATLMDFQKARDDVMLNIVQAYMEILFAEELVLVSEAQTEVTKQQISRAEQLVEAGSLAKGSLLEIQAQLAREELALVTDQNSVKLAYLNLYQLLELPISESFQIQKPVLPELRANLSISNSIDVYHNALEVRPEIQAAQYRVASAEKQLDIAKGYRWPSLNLNASYYNLYNNQYKYIGSDNTIPFDEQLKNNSRASVALSLRIPIFNRSQVNTNIANSELQIDNYRYELQTISNTLRKEIEQAFANAVASLNKYVSTQKAVVSMTEAFRYVEEKFNVGMVNSVDYNLQKTQLTLAQSQLLQAKYEFIFRTKILDFYNGLPIEL